MKDENNSLPICEFVGLNPKVVRTTGDQDTKPKVIGTRPRQQSRPKVVETAGQHRDRSADLIIND